MTFPEAILTNHIAALGKTGSGKTSTAKKLVEEVVGRGARVCVLDTLKSDWWGMISSADGKKPGLPFKILGGPHGHVGLPSSAGKAIGELVGAGKLPLSIVDMADFEAGGIQRFFNAFAPALLKNMRGVLYLVIEEAHEIAPKERAGFGDENMTIHYAKKLATAGRSKGIRLIVCTQRTQALHNAVLGSCETVIAHRLTTPADQKPVIDWLKANTAKDVMEKVSGELSSLPTGTGWICSGEARIFERVAFPRIRTYDNSATPTEDSGTLEVKSAEVDADALRSIIGDAVKEADANDPKKLRARIAELERDARKAPAVVVPDEGALEEAFRRGFDRGAVDGRRRCAVALRSEISAISEAAHSVDLRLVSLLTEIDDAAAAPEPAPVNQGTPKPASGQPQHTSPAQPSKRPVAIAAKSEVSMANGADLSLTGPQRHLLQALAWWKAMGHEEPTRTQLAAIAVWKPKGSNLRNRLSELSSMGFVDYPRGGLVRLTPAGVAAAPEPDLSVTLVDSIRAILTGPQKQVFETLMDFRGDAMTRNAIAAHINWEPGGSNLRNRLSELSALEIVEYPSKGEVALQEWVTG